ncbi:SIR2 family NAD-dependent protein deacylase [Thalassoglobus polymorphus]|uniref:protein acetyllysine N-acetyltransferase n=1 Tax=Thalassoglobus polymorphus TaxID=2527994 RepID=A0A517QM46_9PLAN|nr:Sir2 family NAD-dependent protein deacetylase [Thalassoglobus polymorphus]QDT32706.1 NAD-dependent protein deacetylase [Thalassoglobus polymorphus]
MTESALQGQFESIAGWLFESQSAIAFTGAGISTESGIPDFRSPGGVWSKNRTVYFDEFLNSEADRYEYWRQKSQTHVEFEAASPNSAHRVLVEWETEGKLSAVVTQNIDGLHVEAGSQNVLELHGTAREIGCLSCEKRWPADPWVQRFLKEDRVPSCPDCSGLLKHATVSFGQALPEEVLQRSIELASNADLCFACGSSLVVHPAAGIPEVTKRNGGRLIIINRTETPLDHLADVIIREPLGSTLSQIQQFYMDRC